MDHLQKTKKNPETGDSQYIYQNDLNESCLQHDMVYVGFKDLTRKRASDKILCDKAFNIAKNHKYNGYQCGLASMVYKFFDKKSSGRTIKNEDLSRKESAEELHKPIIRKFKIQEVHSLFIDNIWRTDLAECN